MTATSSSTDSIAAVDADRDAKRRPVLTPLRGSAGALVKHMERSLTVPTATTMRTFSVAGLDALIAFAGEQGVRLSASRIIAYAVARAAAARPRITARFVT